MPTPEPAWVPASARFPMRYHLWLLAGFSDQE